MRNLSDFAVLRNMCLLSVAALKEFRQEWVTELHMSAAWTSCFLVLLFKVVVFFFCQMTSYTRRLVMKPFMN